MDMSIDNKRKYRREDESTYSEVVLQIQDGLRFSHVVALVVDSSSGGAQFVTDVHEAVKKGSMVLIETHVGDPPKRTVIEGRIAWVLDEAGKLLFGCQYLAPQKEKAQFP